MRYFLLIVYFTKSDATYKHLKIVPAPAKLSQSNYWKAENTRLDSMIIIERLGPGTKHKSKAEALGKSISLNYTPTHPQKLL